MKQMLDLIYSLACQYDITDEDVQALCRAMGVDYQALLNHSIQ